MPHFELPNPPLEQPPLPFGLFSAATPIEFPSERMRAGFWYEYDCSVGAQTWPGMCGASAPAPVDVTAAPALTGARTGTDPDFVYALSIAIPSTPTTRTYTVAVTADGDAYTIQATGAGTPVTIYTDRTTVSAGTITITDNASGDVLGPFQWAQSADGTATTDLPASWAYTDDGHPPKNSPGDWQVIIGDPFTVVATDDCLPFKYTLDQIRERARRRLRVNEQGAVERALWTGDQNNRPALAHSDPEILGGSGTTPVDIVTAVGLIEQWYASNVTGAGPGFVHAPRRVAALAKRFALADAFGTIRQTPLQNTWVFGEGYPGTGPENVAPAAGAAWVYVTSPVLVYRSQIKDDAASAHEQNATHTQAERSYALAWTCGTAAVQIATTANNTGNPEGTP